MSTQVLLALADAELFKGMSDEEIDHVTEALVSEIDSDSHLKRRLANTVSHSVAEMLARKNPASTHQGS